MDIPRKSDSQKPESETSWRWLGWMHPVMPFVIWLPVASAAITPSTGEAFIRARARQMSMKVQSTGAGYGWRVGYVRLDGRTDGRR